MNVVGELDGSNNFSAWQAWGPTGLVARRQVLSNNAGPGALATTAIYQYDQRGNLVHRLNADGTQHRLSASTPLSNYGHSAWGERLNEGATGLNYGRSDGPVGFGGQFGYATDVETGLILCGFRYYDPQNGRWLTRDPISYDGGVNVYAYVESNPMRYVDPSGLFVETAWDVLNVGLGAASFGHNWSEGNYGAAALDAVGLAYDGAATFIPILPGGAGTGLRLARGGAAVAEGAIRLRSGAGAALNSARIIEAVGRNGKQPRLRDLENEACQPRHVRGWVKQEKNAITRRKRRSIRVPPGYEMAHKRGRRAKDGHGYEDSYPQNPDLHKLEHKHEGY